MRIASADALGDRMGDRDEFDVERADRDPLAGATITDRDLRRARLAQPPRLDEAGGEARHDRPRAPKAGQSSASAPIWSSWAWVMTMPTRSFFDPLDEADVGHDEIDAGQPRRRRRRRRGRPSAICAPAAARSRRGRNSCRFRRSPPRARTRARCRRSSRSGLPRTRADTPPQRAVRSRQNQRSAASIVSSPSPRETADGRRVEPFEGALAPSRAAHDPDALAEAGSHGEPAGRECAAKPRRRATQAFRRTALEPANTTSPHGAAAPVSDGGRIADAVRARYAQLRHADDAGEERGRAASRPRPGVPAHLAPSTHEIIRPFEAARRRRRDRGAPARARRPRRSRAAARAPARQGSIRSALA